MHLFSTASLTGELRHRRTPLAGFLAAAVLLGLAGTASAQAPGAGSTVYRCPGNPVLYTDSLSAEEARSKGCKAIEGAPITVIQGPVPRGAGTAPLAASAVPPDQRVKPAEQRARDNDARRILQDELNREEAQRAELARAYNGGQPERLGDERNYQRYLDRVAEMKAALERKEADIAAIKRELAKLGP